MALIGQGIVEDFSSHTDVVFHGSKSDQIRSESEFLDLGSGWPFLLIVAVWGSAYKSFTFDFQHTAKLDMRT